MRLLLTIILFGFLTGPALAEELPVKPPLPPKPVPIHYVGDEGIIKYCGAGVALIAGCYDGTSIWVVKHADSFTVAHEIGHAYDDQVMSWPERYEFARLIGRPLTHALDWWVYKPKFFQAELFADAYATCRLQMLPNSYSTNKVSYGGWITSYGYYPYSNDFQRRICRAIKRWYD